jgi:tetratricopeptide (TPR) repeat protein
VLTAAENLQGRVLLGAGKDDEALGHFEKAVAVAPHFTKARYNIGLIKLKHQQLDEALAAFSTVVAQDPKSADAHYFLGVLYKGKNDEGKATASFCKAKELGNAMARSACP